MILNNILKGRKFLFSAFLLFSPAILFSENIDTALIKIERNNKFFKNASQQFDVNKQYLKSIVLVERLLNFDWSDNALDEIFARSGLNSSIGFCQVKIKTAYFIEKQLNDSTSKFYPGYKYFSLLKISKSPTELMQKLQNDSLNIMYAAAYLKIIINLWEKAGHTIQNRPDILGTLYSTGLFKANGILREPNAYPKPNRFGKITLKYLYMY